jgi:hypothetical protein
MPGPPGAQLGATALASGERAAASLVSVSAAASAKPSVAASATPEAPPLVASALASSAPPEDVPLVVPDLPMGLVPEPVALTAPAAAPLPAPALSPLARPPQAAIASSANADSEHWRGLGAKGLSTRAVSHRSGLKARARRRALLAAMPPTTRALDIKDELARVLGN